MIREDCVIFLAGLAVWELSLNYKDDLIPQACDFFRSSSELVTQWQRAVKLPGKRSLELPALFQSLFVSPSLMCHWSKLVTQPTLV